MSDESNNAGSKVVLFESQLEAAAGRVAERAMNETWGGASSFFGDVWGGLVGDRTKQWRTRNLVNSLAKTKDHLEKQGISIETAKSLPMGELYVIFEGASKTDDIDLSKMWSALLSNGMNPEKDTFIDPSFPRLLGSLSGLDARILHYINSYQSLAFDYSNEITFLWAGVDLTKGRQTESYAAAELKNQQIFTRFRDEADELCSELNASCSEIHISYSISNLLRLGLLDRPNDLLIGRELVSLQQSVYGGKVVVNTHYLDAVIKDIRQRLNSGFEADKALPKLTSNNPFLQQTAVPTYTLSGYAKRFLEACT